MRWPLVTAALVVAGCSFDPHGVPITGGGATDASLITPTIDAPRGVPDASPPDMDVCPFSYKPIAGAPDRYRIVTTAKNWLDAEADCELDGLAHLVVLRDDSERDAVRGAATGELWMGATDRVTEGMFLKVTGGAATYLPWLAGEPNDLFGEDCVELKGGGFNDDGCDNSHPYVCECDGAAAVPAAYTAP